jgi:hypothetical protein
MVSWATTGQGSKVRRLMEVEAANMLRIPRMSVSELNRKGLGARYWLGSTVPWEVAEAVMKHCQDRQFHYEEIRRAHEEENRVEEGEGREQELMRRRASGGPRKWLGVKKMASGNINESVTLLLGSCIAESSRGSYDGAFKHWLEWRTLRGSSIWLDESAEDVEDELLKFVAHRGMVLGYAHGTVHVMLNSIRHQHMLNRKGNPLEDRPLVRMAMKGLKRLQGGVVRKVPATVVLLKLAIGGVG